MRRHRLAAMVAAGQQDLPRRIRRAEAQKLDFAPLPAAAENRAGDLRNFGEETLEIALQILHAGTEPDPAGPFSAVNEAVIRTAAGTEPAP